MGIYKSERFKKFNDEVLNKSHTNIWDYYSGNGQNIVIYTNDNYCYMGQINTVHYNNKSGEVDWLSLGICKKLRFGKVMVDFTKDTNNSSIIIRIKDINNFYIIHNEPNIDKLDNRTLL